MRWVLFNILTLVSEPPYIRIKYQNFISENLLTCQLVHTSCGNSSQSSDVTH